MRVALNLTMVYVATYLHYVIDRQLHAFCAIQVHITVKLHLALPCLIT